jgi:hypothetical protein
MIAMDTRPLPTELAQPEPSRGQLSRWVRGAAASIATWMTTCADYYAAAARYEELSRLSDGELERRGLSRDRLARDLCEAAERHTEL